MHTGNTEQKENRETHSKTYSRCLKEDDIECIDALSLWTVTDSSTERGSQLSLKGNKRLACAWADPPDREAGLTFKRHNAQRSSERMWWEMPFSSPRVPEAKMSQGEWLINSVEAPCPRGGARRSGLLWGFPLGVHTLAVASLFMRGLASVCSNRICFCM